MPITPPSNATKAWQGLIHAAWEWPQEMFDGTTQTFECITRQDTTTVIAFSDDGTIVLTKQEQPGRPAFIDVPGGRVDDGEDHLTACRREFQEETGYTAADEDWMQWSLRAHRGGVRFEQTIFVARHAKKTHEAHADAGERIEVMHVAWDELVTMCLTGKMRQTSVMYAILCMQFDPGSRERLRTWLGKAPSDTL